MSETGQSSRIAAIFTNIIYVLIKLYCFTPYFLKNTQINAIWPEPTALRFLHLQHVFFIGSCNLSFLWKLFTEIRISPSFLRVKSCQRTKQNSSLGLCSSNLIIPIYNITWHLYVGESVIWPSWSSTSEVCLLFTNTLTFFLKWFCSVFGLSFRLFSLSYLDLLLPGCLLLMNSQLISWIDTLGQEELGDI